MSGSVRIFWVPTLRRMTSPLTTKVKESFPEFSASWLDDLWLVLQCLLLSRTTNLAKAKDHVAGVLGTEKARATKPQSHYTRLIRFFKLFSYRDDTIGLAARKLIATLTVKLLAEDPTALGRIGKKLLLDGTEWKIRQSKVQFLTLAILIDNVSVPIAYLDLEKIGHSSQEERIDWFTKLSESFNFKGMTLLADREYIGLEWFEALRITFGMNFVIRIKKSIYHQQVNAMGGKTQTQLEEKLRRCKSKKQVSKRLVLGSAFYYYIICRNPKADHPDEDEFIYLLTSWFNRNAAAEAYKSRWAIEVTFRHLKTNGFNLEDMKVEGKMKREFMFDLLNLLYVMAIIQGRKFYQRNPSSRYTKVDPNTGKVTLVHSVFRIGLSRILANFNTSTKMARWLRQVFQRQKVPKWAFV